MVTAWCKDDHDLILISIMQEVRENHVLKV